MRTTKPSEYARLQPKNPNVQTNPTNSEAIVYDKNTIKEKNQKRSAIRAVTGDGTDIGRYFSDSLQQVNTHHKTYQNEQILVDDKGRRLNNFTVYKDLVRSLSVSYIFRWYSLTCCPSPTSEEGFSCLCKIRRRQQMKRETSRPCPMANAEVLGLQVVTLSSHRHQLIMWIILRSRCLETLSICS